jgi:hypothetical protein
MPPSVWHWVVRSPLACTEYSQYRRERHRGIGSIAFHDSLVRGSSFARLYSRPSGSIAVTSVMYSLDFAQWKNMYCWQYKVPPELKLRSSVKAELAKVIVRYTALDMSQSIPKYNGQCFHFDSSSIRDDDSADRRKRASGRTCKEMDLCCAAMAAEIV